VETAATITIVGGGNVSVIGSSLALVPNPC
jgi:hypothetical protein